MSDGNDEATRAWNGVLFEKFARFKPLLTGGLALHGQALLARRPPPAGGRVLDLGCGFGDLTRSLADSLAPSQGQAVGVDVAQNFVEASTRDSIEAGTKNAEFFRADVQTDDLRGPYDAAYSRFGTQFFASPVAALRNVRRSLASGSFLSFVVWRKREDNPWLHVPELCVRSLIAPEEETANEPTCGPGPFSMRGADLVSDQLKAAGFEQIGFERHEADICIGRDLDEALAFAMALGPAGEIMRLAGDVGKEKAPQVAAALREALSGFVSPRGVYAPSSTWLITARA
ncbi:MAG TPA: class I SAM-dependent methyltransferase [Polyangiaceae bacterium]|nr:class I SAM-dependent methyltransferase [Polyangiaceae bacterium]